MFEIEKKIRYFEMLVLGMLFSELYIRENISLFCFDTTENFHYAIVKNTKILLIFSIKVLKISFSLLLFSYVIMFYKY